MVRSLIQCFSVGGVGRRSAERVALADERAHRVVVLREQLEEVQRRREERRGQEAFQDSLVFLALTATTTTTTTTTTKAVEIPSFSSCVLISNVQLILRYF